MKYPEAIAPNLLHWYTINKRALPWRENNSPYSVWLAEIIMQQTRISQGLPYYLRFVENYPTVVHLAQAHEDEILKLWQGLGYYSRARNMHEAAKTIVDQHQGHFPESYSELLKLKGVGEYTAAAIASISFNLPHAVIDGNVYRVLSRLFAISTPINSTEGKNAFKQLANQLIDRESPGDYNQAIMDFGAMQCKPTQPDCPNCPFSNSCQAFLLNQANRFPVKEAKQKIRHRYFNYLLIEQGENICLNKRTGNDIWKNLFEFPLIEMNRKTEINELADQLMELIRSQNMEIGEITSWQKQILSHQHIHYRFIRLRITAKSELPPQFMKVNKKDIYKFAVPKPIERELERLDW